MLFDEAAIGDEGTTLVAAGAAQSIDDLYAFVTRAITAARTLAQGADRIPPPASMAAFVPAWRAFAGALGGRLTLGDMAIRDAAFDQAPLRITTAWIEKGEPSATEVRLPITPRDDVATTEESLDPASRALLQSLKLQTAALVISRDVIVAKVLAPLEDPATIEPLLIGLSRLARLLNGGTSRGPYR